MANELGCEEERMRSREGAVKKGVIWSGGDREIQGLGEARGKMRRGKGNWAGKKIKTLYQLPQLKTKKGPNERKLTTQGARIKNPPKRKQKTTQRKIKVNRIAGRAVKNQSIAKKKKRV